jgi:GT2 family glycosyltransferase
MKVTMVVPIYDDFESLQVLVKWIEVTPADQISFLVVDNGSTDDRVSKLLSNSRGNWRGIRSDTNLGFGGGILFGASRAETEFVGWMPGNLKIDPRDIPDFLKSISFSEKIIVKARRVSRSKSAHIKTILLGMAQSIFLRTPMFDAGGTPTICSKEFLLSLPNPPQDYAFESFVLFKARKAKMKVSRPSIVYTVRKFGSSHWQKGLSSEIALFISIIKKSQKWR